MLLVNVIIIILIDSFSPQSWIGKSQNFFFLDFKSKKKLNFNLKKDAYWDYRVNIMIPVIFWLAVAFPTTYRVLLERCI